MRKEREKRRKKKGTKEKKRKRKNKECRGQPAFGRLSSAMFVCVSRLFRAGSGCRRR